MSDWRKIISDDLKAERRESPQPWWSGWLYPEEVFGLLIVLAVAVLVACIIWGFR